MGRMQLLHNENTGGLYIVLHTVYIGRKKMPVKPKVSVCEKYRGPTGQKALEQALPTALHHKHSLLFGKVSVQWWQFLGKVDFL